MEQKAREFGFDLQEYYTKRKRSRDYAEERTI